MTALGAACLLPLMTGTAEAASPVLGLLSVAVTPTATLSVSGSVASGSLGTTTVLDTRTGSTGYLVSVSTDGFDLVGPPVTGSASTHIPTTAAAVSVTAASGGTPSSTASVALPSLAPVFQMTYPSAVGLIGASSSYRLGLTVTIPAAAGPGRYTGTVTQSLV